MADDSKVSNVGGRYAQALFDLANEQKQVAAVEADLKSLKAAIAEAGLARQALHAAVLGFVHPITGETLRFETAPPPDMSRLEALLRAF